MTPEQIKGRLKNITKEKNIDFNALMKLFLYERLLDRLSKSPYNVSKICQLTPVSAYPTP